MDLSLLPLAIGPAAILLHIAWMLDRPNREPWRNVLRYLGAGAISSGLAWLAEGLLGPLSVGVKDPAVIWPVRLVLVFLGVGLVEEGAKFLCLNGAARGDRELDEPFDWVVYAVSVALGFAAVENLRVLWQGAGVGWTRAWSAIPAHALDGTLMGCRLAMGMRDDPSRRSTHRVLAVIEPAFWHSAYDHLLFQMRVTSGPAPGLVLLWFGVVLAQWIVAANRVAALWQGQPGTPPPIIAPLETIKRFGAGPRKPTDPPGAAGP